MFSVIFTGAYQLIIRWILVLLARKAAKWIPDVLTNRFPYRRFLLHWNWYRNSAIAVRIHARYNPEVNALSVVVLVTMRENGAR